ncbi:MAG: BolA family protein [Woeseiaceae bacterium]|nr:BolA family protein [Woeseiaceae bacterium]
MNEARIQLIERLLKEKFRPQELLIKDQSHLHAGHAGAKDGRGHFDVSIVAEAFRGVEPLKRHRMVFDALGDLLQTDIHALRSRRRLPMSNVRI